MRRNRVQELWGSYRTVVLPKDAPPVQITECRRAFYAGCESLLVALMKALEPGTDETPADLRLMEEIDAELKAFAISVKEGRN